LKKKIKGGKGGEREKKRGGRGKEGTRTLAPAWLLPYLLICPQPVVVIERKKERKEKRGGGKKGGVTAVAQSLTSRAALCSISVPERGRGEGKEEEGNPSSEDLSEGAGRGGEGKRRERRLSHTNFY